MQKYGCKIFSMSRMLRRRQKALQILQSNTRISRMHQGASGLDGTSKKWIHPLRTALIPIMAALFSYVYLHGATLSAWSLTVIVSLEKKSSGAAGNVMDGYRGLHILNFCRQWYAQCLNDRLRVLVCRSVPLEQQGFCPERKIHAFTALHAIIGRARLGWAQNGGDGIFAAILDAKKAFPSVRRSILLHKLALEHFATAGSLPFDVRTLIRALIPLHSEATATVRGSDDCSAMFDINSGTREGGVESPWFYILFVPDLIQKINEVELSEDPIFIGNRKMYCTLPTT